MDPLTHAVIGRAVVAAARDEVHDRAAGAAAILGALSPDVDSAIAFAGWDRYVRAHQSGTHSIAGALVTALLAAALVAAIARVVRRWRARDDRPPLPPFTTLLAAAAAGAMSHIALDLASGARIAVAWPIAGRRVSLPLVAMADPWFVAIAAGGLLILRLARVRLHTAARYVVAAAAIFLAVKAALLSAALRRADFHPSAVSAIEARWGSLTDWYVFERTSDEVRASAISSGGGSRIGYLTQPLAPEPAIVRASRSLDDVANFLAVHEFAFAVETPDEDDRIAVLWSDLRYCGPAPAGADDPPPPRPSARCGVWVGGVYDRAGRAITEEVRIGWVVQRRPPP